MRDAFWEIAASEAFWERTSFEAVKLIMYRI